MDFRSLVYICFQPFLLLDRWVVPIVLCPALCVRRIGPGGDGDFVFTDAQNDRFRKPFPTRI
jgi:hypothetical protein